MLAFLVRDGAGGLAGGLAGSLALAAATLDGAGLQVRFVESFDMFHVVFTSVPVLHPAAAASEHSSFLL